jgi:D-alanyl-D-alanine dipeptidase
MVLLIDPYANRHLSMADIRLLNRVAAAMADAHEDLDPSDLAGAIVNAYRPGMAAQALMMHTERHLRRGG